MSLALESEKLTNSQIIIKHKILSD